MSLAAQIFIGIDLALSATTIFATSGWRRAVNDLKTVHDDEIAFQPMRQMMNDQNLMVRHAARALLYNLRYYTENTDPNAMVSFNAVQGMLGADILNLENALKGVAANVYHDPNPPTETGDG